MQHVSARMCLHIILFPFSACWTHLPLEVVRLALITRSLSCEKGNLTCWISGRLNCGPMGPSPMFKSVQLAHCQGEIFNPSVEGGYGTAVDYQKLNPLEPRRGKRVWVEASYHYRGNTMDGTCTAMWLWFHVPKATLASLYSAADITHVKQEFRLPWDCSVSIHTIDAISLWKFISEHTAHIFFLVHQNQKP